MNDKSIRPSLRPRDPDVAFKISDIMRMLDVKKKETIYGMINRKEITAVKVGREYRIFPEAWEAFKAGETVPQMRERKTRQRTAELPEWARGVKRTIIDRRA